MNPAPSFQQLASASNSQGLETLAFMADFYQNQPQTSTAMEMDMGLGDSIPESSAVLSAHNVLNNVLSDTEADLSETSLAEIIYRLQRQIEDLETELAADRQRYDGNQRNIRQWCQQITEKVQKYNKKRGKKSPAASNV